MSFREWSTFVEVLSEEKELDIHDVREALVLCGPPVVPAIQVIAINYVGREVYSYTSIY